MAFDSKALRTRAHWTLTKIFCLLWLNNIHTIWKSKTISEWSASISWRKCKIKITESREKRRIPLFNFRLLWRNRSGMLWLSSRTVGYGNTMWATANFSWRTAKTRLLLRRELHLVQRLLRWSFWSLRRTLRCKFMIYQKSVIDSETLFSATRAPAFSP